MLRASVIGNLGNDPELKYSSSGSPILRFNVASNLRVKEDGEWTDKTEWVRCTVFGNRAETLSNHLTKGMKVYIDGRLEARPWTDQNDNPRAGLEVLADTIEFMSARSDDQQQSRRPSRGQPDDSDLPF